MLHFLHTASDFSEHFERIRSVGQKWTVATQWLPFLNTVQYSTGFISKEIKYQEKIKSRKICSAASSREAKPTYDKQTHKQQYYGQTGKGS
jgi:hypothetical protein